MNTIQKAPNIRIIPSEHFWVQGLKRTFELSCLVPLYIQVSQNLKTIERDVEQEFSIGRVTILYSVGFDNNIKLITGWVGNRSKKVVL